MADAKGDIPRTTLLFTRRPWAVVAVMVLLTLFFGYFAKDIERDHSNERMLPADEPIRAYYDEFKKHFDIKTKIAIALVNDGGVFTPEVLAQVDRVSAWLKQSGFINPEKIYSLTTVENIIARDGELFAGPLVENPPETAREAKAVREAAFENRLIAKALVSADEKATLIVAQPTFMTYQTDESSAAYDAIRRMLAEDPGPCRSHFAGFPMVIGLTDRYMDRDNRVMLPIILAMVIVLLWISFRSLRGVWIPLAVVLTATIWTFGAMHMAGIKITIISTSIPIVLVAMGIADGIHVIHEYYHRLRKGEDNRTAVLLTMKEMNPPVAMTSFTTAAGFLALGTSEIVPIREYGAAVAFGILAAMVFSLAFIPACLILLGKPRRLLSAEVAEGGLLHRFSRAIGTFSLRRAKALIAAFVILLVLTSAIGSQIRALNNPVHYFRQNSDIRVSDEFINSHFGGTGEVHVQVYGGTDGALKDPDLVARIRRLQDRIERLDHVGSTRSIADFLMRMHLVLHDGDPAYDRVPGTPQDLGPDAEPGTGRALIGQYLLLYEISGGTELAHTVDFGYQRANLEVQVNSHSSDIYERIVDGIHRAADEIFPEGITVGQTGSGVVNLKIVQYLVLGQIYSLAVSFVVVFFMLVFLFRSLVHALIGVIPLVITVAGNFAIMVLTGIPLNIGTALIASVSIGVGVDYSIHFINRYRLEAGRTPDLASTVAVTMDTSGRAILLNAAAVGGGFAVLLFSSFMPIVYLGFLIPLIMTINALAALIVIPAFLNVLFGSVKKAKA